MSGERKREKNQEQQTKTRQEADPGKKVRTKPL
jgi:hypothetical protein